jgi:hypothetical protein
MGRIIDIDTTIHMAYDSDGSVFEIDSYSDSEDEPCLPEEATYAYVRVGSTRFKKIQIYRE